MWLTPLPHFVAKLEICRDKVGWIQWSCLTANSCSINTFCSFLVMQYQNDVMCQSSTLKTSAPIKHEYGLQNIPLSKMPFQMKGSSEMRMRMSHEVLAALDFICPSNISHTKFIYLHILGTHVESYCNSFTFT